MTNNVINEEEFQNFVFLLALEAAVSFGGSANPKSVSGKVFPKYPQIKQDLQHYLNEIENIVTQVNQLKPEEQKSKLLKLNPNFGKLDEKKKEENKKEIGALPVLEGMIEGKPVRVRTEPAPSGFLHLGHVYNITYNYEYVKKYGGQFIVRFGDTNPEKIALENYENILKDINWLTDGGINEIYYESDRNEIYYKYLRQLVEQGNAYICSCSSEDFKNFNDSSAPCPHREIPVKKQIIEYENMFNGKTKEGDAVIRFKADLNNPNPAMRDFPLARINEEEHARKGKKYRVWPMMNLATAVDDVLMNLTHVVRGKDHEINMERQSLIHKALGMKSPVYYHLGRIQLEDIELSKSKLTQAIKDGVYTGWDDPRVPTLIAHKKRGYKAKAFRQMVLAKGMSKRDSRVTATEYYKSLDFFNKQILEKEADRFFFIQNSVPVHIVNISKFPDKEIVLPKHPDDASRGSRHFKVESDYIIEKSDFEKILPNTTIRLMHFANFKVLEKKSDSLVLEYVSKDYDKNLKPAANIHFLPSSGTKNVEIIYPDTSRVYGVCEDMHNPKEDNSYQFERFGFVRFDHKNSNGVKVFYYTQK